MAILGIGGKKSRKPRATGVELEARERTKLLKLKRRALQAAFEANPELLHAWALKDIGISGEQQGEIAKFLSTAQGLKKAGIPISLKGGSDDEDSLTGMLSALAVPVGEFLRGRNLEAQTALRQAELEIEKLRLQAEILRLGGTPGSPAPVVEQPSLTQQIAAPAPAESNAPLTPESEYLVNALGSLPAEQAAQWFLDQPQPAIKQIAALLVNTEDDKLPARLSTIAQQVPAVAGFISWVRQRPEWFLDTVHALRQKANADTQTQQAGAMGV